MVTTPDIRNLVCKRASEAKAGACCIKIFPSSLENGSKKAVVKQKVEAVHLK